MIYLTERVLIPVPRDVASALSDVSGLHVELLGFAVLGGRGAAGLVPVVSVPALSLVPAVPAV